MKVAIIYKSNTGNTKLVAEAINNALKENIVYIGEPVDSIEADFYFIGSWTDKGMCCTQIADYIKTLENKEIAYFGTAGFGGSEDYYHSLFERVKSICPDSNNIKEYFFCQGKMPIRVREKYESMLGGERDQLATRLIKNFDEALFHPSSEDFRNAASFARTAFKNMEADL